MKKTRRGAHLRERADETEARILSHVIANPLDTASEIAKVLRLHRATVYRHLKRLRSAR